MAHQYTIRACDRAGRERLYPYACEAPLQPGEVVRLGGRDWLITEAEAPRRGAASAVAVPARYRLRLRHPDGREELGALRRFRPDGPRLGHAFATAEDGHQASWQVVEERLARDEHGSPYLELVAERDYGELEAVPDHELEHTLAAAPLQATGARAAVAQAQAAGLALEMVALEPGEEPDWGQAERYIEALVLEEIGDDLLRLCGVDPDEDAPDTWLDTVKERLRSDLQRFRADVETDRDQIEQWDFRDGRVLAAAGDVEDEADPHSGYGWMCRLVDSGVLAAAGFARVRKADLNVS